jgi:spore germination protein GerM
MRRWLLPLALLVVIAGAAIFYFTWGTQKPEEITGEIEIADELGTRSVTLYFGNRRADGLVSETRSIQTRLHRDEEVEAVVAELIAGPERGGAVRTLPAGTRLRQAFYDEEQRLLYLDFSQELVSGLNGGSAMELVTLGALLKTIAVDFPEIEQVQILVDGLEVETLGGHVDVTRPLRTAEWL